MSKTTNLNGVVTDVIPVTPADSGSNGELSASAVGFVVAPTGSNTATSGTISCVMENGETRTIPFVSNYWHYCAVRRIRASGLPSGTWAYYELAVN